MPVCISQSRAPSSPSSHHEPEDFSYSNYLSYILYPPLFLAGPIITFQSFNSQIKRPPTIPRRSILAYAIRFAVCFLTMELVLHYMYVVAIKDSWVVQKGSTVRRYAWDGDSPFELAIISLWNLIVVWLKVRCAALGCRRSFSSQS